MKQIYVSEETAKLIEELPRGSKTKIIDYILQSFLNEVINRARIKDLKDDNFPIFFENMLKQLCEEKNNGNSNKEKLKEKQKGQFF